MQLLPPLFTLLAFLDHAAAVLFWSRSYRVATQDAIGNFNWYEYFVSAPLMNLLIVGLCGCLDFFVQLSTSVLTATTMFSGARVQRILYDTNGSARGKMILHAGI